MTVDDHTRLTLVRPNIFGYHVDTIPHLESPYHYTDIGTHYFKIRLYLHQGKASQEIDKRFSAFIEPLKVIRNNLVSLQEVENITGKTGDYTVSLLFNLT